MLTRRENLLIRPWQQRRYDSHREKVIYNFVLLLLVINLAFNQYRYGWQLLLLIQGHPRREATSLLNLKRCSSRTRELRRSSMIMCVSCNEWHLS